MNFAYFISHFLDIKTLRSWCHFLVWRTNIQSFLLKKGKGTQLRNFRPQKTIKLNINYLKRSLKALFLYFQESEQDQARSTTVNILIKAVSKAIVSYQKVMTVSRLFSKWYIGWFFFMKCLKIYVPKWFMAHVFKAVNWSNMFWWNWVENKITLKHIQVCR